MEAGDRNEYIEFKLRSYGEMSDLDNDKIDGNSNTDESQFTYSHNFANT